MIMLGGKGSDILYGMAAYHKDNKRYPDYVMINIPRSQEERWVSYPALEALKDGIFFSPKYEGVMCRYPPIKLVVWANQLPDTSHFSKDRWNIIALDEL